jgi:hypothetical protein
MLYRSVICQDYLHTNVYFPLNGLKQFEPTAYYVVNSTGFPVRRITSLSGHTPTRTAHPNDKCEP